MTILKFFEMKHYSELSPLEKKAREASGRLKCTDCPIYKLCKTSEMFIDACDFIYLSAFKTGLLPLGAKWDVDFAEFPNIVQLAWAVNEKERSYIIKPDGWEIPEASTEVHGITAERANAEGVTFADIIDEFLEDCEKAEDALFKGKRIDTMMKTIKFVGAIFANGRPGKFPTLEELYNKCFPGETFPAHDALEDVKACKRCIPVLVENGIIELKPKE